MKKKIARRKKRGRKRLLKNKWLLLTILFFAIVLPVCFYFFVFSSSTPVYEARPHTAAIIDQLGMTHPNATFVQNVENTLVSAGFTVDYYNYSEITVDFYRRLPSKRYSLIILRVHSGVGKYTGLTSLYTSESYNDWAHYTELVNEQVVPVQYVEDGPKYFAVTSSFFKTVDICRNSLVIMMGCDGLKKDDMAKAFVERGAKVYISWNGPVLPGHTDKAIDQLLRNIVSKGQTLGEAISSTMDTVGSDPQYHSLLLYYPSEAGAYKLKSASRFPIQSFCAISVLMTFEKRPLERLQQNPSIP